MLRFFSYLNVATKDVRIALKSVVVDNGSMLCLMVTSNLVCFKLFATSVFEPRHDKTNKMSVRPARTLISLGIRPI